MKKCCIVDGRSLYQGVLFLFLVFFYSLYSMTVCAEEKPIDFVYLQDWVPTIQKDVRYYTADNFIGRPISGYKKPVCLLTKQAADALLRVQNTLNKKQLGLKVFDCYRPRMAVDDFLQWSQNPLDQKMKAAYYPRVNKEELFKLGYIALRSGHSRGSTVDLTVIDLRTRKPLDMGTSFDFMDPLSHPACRLLTTTQLANRKLLRMTMMKFGFTPLSTEWWHFTLTKEPYKDRYFNFPVA